MKTNTSIKKYSMPRIEVIVVEAENGIAVGSARVQPYNSNYEIFEEWDEEPKTDRAIDW